MRVQVLAALYATLTMTNAAQAMPLRLLCEYGQRVTVGGDVRRDNAIEIDWQGKLYKMLRVGTSTGAHRFEDPVSGLIWISIPSKAMLLDGRRGQPVAQECRAGAGASPLR